MSLFRKLFHRDRGSEPAPETTYERSQRLYDIGINSYVASPFVAPDNVVIGKYCAIAYGAVVGMSDHPMHHLSSHGFTAGAGADYCEIKVPEDRVCKWDGRNKVIVGNDVWIGRNAVVKGGVRIGDGAVVGAGAVVTKDVPPYAIVAGVPAKIIRYRFDERTVERLLAVRWWDFPQDFIATKLKFDDIGQCLDVLESNLHLRS